MCGGWLPIPRYYKSVAELREINESSDVIAAMLRRVLACLRACDADEEAEKLEVQAILSLFGTFVISMSDEAQTLITRFEALVPDPKHFDISACDISNLYFTELAAIYYSFDHCSITAPNSWRPGFVLISAWPFHKRITKY